ncbi:MAG: hypothetical protein HOV81_33305, partial [Kofleriaceae bacterium]|nr:hypothetical protein [Kofleriaceae bacterium]
MRALCLVLGLSAACTSTTDTAPTGSLGGVAGIEEIDQGLADLSSQCTFDTGTGVMTLALEAGDIAWLSVGIGNTIEVNNIACHAATVQTTKRIDIAEASSGDQTVIVDARTGSLGLGRATGVGLTVVLGSGNDQFKLIGSNGADRIVVGASGIAFGADPYLDYTLSGVESVTINGDAGNDTISGAGDTVTGAAYPDPLLLYGGDGTDSLRGGAGDDHCWGGDGDDTFLGGPAADGADSFTGGPGRDTADYAARTANLSLSLEDVANDGASAEGDNIESDVEVVKGGSGADTIAGGVNADTIYGGAGNDTLSGGGGADTLYAEAGDDVFVEAGIAGGPDIFIGGTGTDTIEYARTGG